MGVDLELFEEVADIVRGAVPGQLGEVRTRVRRYGIKVWFGAVEPPREHYEAQVIGAELAEGARVLGLEVGFHAENTDQAKNEKALAHLVGQEKKWRKALGREATAGPFLGRAKTWRRISETWPDPDLAEPELPFELGARLVDYVTALEPLRRVE
ncbi:MAG: hypothetical protein QOG03_2247 [Actinomycetota bacterium]|nr:hypothetical protein [Actinomycetota bacterium]